MWIPVGELLVATFLMARGMEAAPAVPAALGDTMTVTVSAGPIVVQESPYDEDISNATTQKALAASLPSLAETVEATLLSEAEAKKGYSDLIAGRGLAGRDLAGLLKRAAHRLIRSLGRELRDLAEGTGPLAGRRKKNDAVPMLGAGLIMGGTLLTIGLGALAAMSGKALMSAMLALGMSLMSAFRGPGRRCRRSDNNNNNGCNNDNNNNNDNNYEIIARPVITHGHTHSAVLHHDPGMAAAGYPGYVRSLVQTGPPDQIEAIHTAPSTSVDLADFARSGATRFIGRPAYVDSSSDESNPASWVGGVIGMRAPQQLTPPPAPASDSVLSLTLGTWGQGLGPTAGPGQAQPKHRNAMSGVMSSASTQPRAMDQTASTQPRAMAQTASTQPRASDQTASTQPRAMNQTANTVSPASATNHQDE